MHRLVATLLLFSVYALAQQTPASTGMIPTPDVYLAYETFGEAGSATPVIVANGGPGLSHIYMLQNDVWPRLSHNRQIVFYDQRGTGKSKRVAADASFGMDAQVADMEAVRAKFGFQKFDLVGDSYGGLLAMAYAAAHPEHVEKLISTRRFPGQSSSSFKRAGICLLMKSRISMCMWLRRFSVNPEEATFTHA